MRWGAMQAIPLAIYLFFLSAYRNVSNSRIHQVLFTGRKPSFPSVGDLRRRRLEGASSSFVDLIFYCTNQGAFPISKLGDDAEMIHSGRLHLLDVETGRVPF